MAPCRSACLLLLFIVVQPVAAAPPQAPPARPRDSAIARPVSRRLATTPQGAVRSLEAIYENGSVAGMEGLLSADYRFHGSDGDSALRHYPDGLPREREIEVIRVMFEGLRDSTGQVLAPARNVRIRMGGLEESADPEHPDSLSHYRVVVAHKLEFAMVAGDEKLLALPADHIFYLVRGDLAQRVDGQPASASRWYIRRWLENTRAIEEALADVDGRCEEPAPAAADLLAGAFGVRAVNSPLCPTLEVVCDLPVAAPASLEVYDLQGRRLAKQELRPAAPGTMRVLAGGGQRFAPGAYWLRLTQAGQPASRRMVMVAR